MKLLEGLLDKTIPGLEKALDLSWRRNEAISSNIANAETPQYRAVDLNFAGELQRAFGNSQDALMKTDNNHLDISSDGMAHLQPTYTGATKPDGNNVDIDIQMGQLAYNTGKYTNAARMMKKQLGMLRAAIREGGR